MAKPCIACGEWCTRFGGLQHCSWVHFWGLIWDCWLLGHSCVCMLVIKGMKFVLVTANCPALNFYSECYCWTYKHCDGWFTIYAVATIGDSSRIVLDGFLRQSVALKFSEQPLLDPSRWDPPLLGLSAVRWEISETCPTAFWKWLYPFVCDEVVCISLWIGWIEQELVTEDASSKTNINTM